MTNGQGFDAQTPPSGTGCVECLKADPSGWWFHLRRCATCGHIGCCDSSPGQHARAHWASSSHRYVQSFEPGENWFWDFAADAYETGPELAPPHHHPADQPVPGPAGAVPTDWLERLNI